MALIQTVYKRTIKGVAGWHVYSTKSLSPMHRTIHERHPEAKTVLGANSIYTNLTPGIPLDNPIIVGGFTVNVAA